MRVLVCGGRKFGASLEERSLFALEIRRALGDPATATIIEGGANGADYLARRWGGMRGVPVKTFKAEWWRGRKAGPARNQRMLDEGRPDLVIAFPGGRGTADMVRRAKAAGVKVIEVEA